MLEQQIHQDIFAIKTEEDFQSTALRVFNFQAVNNPVYKDYLKCLKVDVNRVKGVEEIPFLPIEFFKSHVVKSFEGEHQELFTSSGTTGIYTSKHFVKEKSIYETSFLQAFHLFYGNPSDWCFVALLPGYLERDGSSLIYMAERLIRESGHADSGFYLNEHEALVRLLQENEQKGQKTMLLGVSFALLDLAEKYQLKLQHTTIMETGGMKGRRKEITRAELHQILQQAFGVTEIHSEYGMTELLSQAYSLGDLRFACPPWMRILIRDAYDPFAFLPATRTGGINVVDLANLHSCSFLETSDLGKKHTNGSFEVLGRFDNADIRGCNLMVE